MEEEIPGLDEYLRDKYADSVDLTKLDEIHKEVEELCKNWEYSPESLQRIAALNKKYPPRKDDAGCRGGT